MQDFTLTTYKKLLQELLANGNSFQTLQGFIQQPAEDKTVILRHDVDRLEGSSCNNPGSSASSLHCLETHYSRLLSHYLSLLAHLYTTGRLFLHK